MSSTDRIDSLLGIGFENRMRDRVAGLQMVLREREAELLQLKGPCSNSNCRLHYAHRGPCVPRLVST